MKSFDGILAILALTAVLACDPGITPGPAADPSAPAFASVSTGAGGAIVSNSGLGQDQVNCHFRGLLTHRGTAVATPDENATLSCLFENLDPIPETELLEGWLCSLNQGGSYETRNSTWRRHPDGHATLSCQFNGKPLNNAAVTSATESFAAQEGVFTEPLFDSPSGRLQGELVFVGSGCFWDPLLADPSGKIALIERGACFYADKLQNVEGSGAIGAIVFNSEAGGEGIVRMIAPDGVTVGIPGVFVARSAGLSMLAGGPVTVTACASSKKCRDVLLRF